jgi:hypothetical protein
MLQTARSRDHVPMRWIFSNLPNSSGRTMTLGSTPPLTEMSTRNLKKDIFILYLFNNTKLSRCLNVDRLLVLRIYNR